MKQSWFVLSLVLIALLTAACNTAATQGDGKLAVTDVQANMTLPSSTGSIWLVITNDSNTDDALVGAEIPGCGAVEFHTMLVEDDVMIMREVEDGRISIPAGQTVELQQGGLHIMCIGKEAPLEAGSSITVALHFANAGSMEVAAEVVAPGAMEMEDMENGDG